MIRTHCHTYNKTGRRYRAARGQRLPHACTQCAFRNDPDDRFCGGCGTHLDPLPRTTVPSPVAYTPRPLAERIRAEHVTLEAHNVIDGERKTLTTLVADLKGSTALIERLDPEEARALIHPALQLMMDAVHRYEGYVAQALGDGIFAFEYNYQREAASQLRGGGGLELPSRATPDGATKGAAMTGTDVATYARERPGINAFVLEDGIVYHTYSAYARGLDGLWGAYQWLDRAPKGRNETGYWWRRHDEYDKR